MAEDLPDAPWATELPDAPWATEHPSSGYIPYGTRVANEFKEGSEQSLLGQKQMAALPKPADSAWENIKRLGYHEWEQAKGAANQVTGASRMAFSPLTAAFASGAHGLTRPIAMAGYPETANALEPAVAASLGMLVPEAPKFFPKAPVLTTRSANALSEAAIARQQQAERAGFNLTRGQAEQDPGLMRAEDLATRTPGPNQAAAVDASKGQFQDIQQGAQNIGAEMAPPGQGPVGSLNQAGGDIASQLGQAAETARATVARTAQTATQESEAQRGIVSDQGRAISEAIQGSHPEVATPQEAGDVVGQAIRERATNERTNFNNLYKEAYSGEGGYHAGAVENVGQQIKGRLTHSDNPVIIDDKTTPVANAALGDLDRLSGLRVQNRADPFGAPDPANIVAVDLRGIEQARKRLVAYYQQAKASGNLSDMRAMSRIMQGFDDHFEQAISNGLFTGDPRTLQAMQEARSAFSNYAQTFRPRGAGDDVGLAMRRILERQATPEEIANMMLGSGKWNAGLPVRMADRLEQVFGRDSEPFNAIRQAIARKVLDPRTASGSIDPQKAASQIFDFANSSLAKKYYSAEELAAFRAHAQGIRDLDKIIASLPETKAAENAAASYEQTFGHQGIGGSPGMTFRKIIEGTATPDEVAKTVLDAVNSGNPGNMLRMIKAVENIVGKDSESMSAIRQGFWKSLTEDMGAQKMVSGINEFLNGNGKGIAEHIYTPAERAKMQNFADAVKHTVLDKFSRTNSDTAVAQGMAGAMQGWIPKSARVIGTFLGHKVAPGFGHFIGHAAEKVVARGSKNAANRAASDQILKSLNMGTNEPSQ